MSSLICRAEDGLSVPAAEPFPELPSLPGEERANRWGTLNLDAATITVRDRAVNDKVSVRVDGFKSPNPLVAFENGWLLSDQIGVGGAYTYRNNFAELFLNGVYAPRPDLRVQMSVAQMRNADALVSPYTGDQKAILQTNYVSSIKKSWDDNWLFNEAGAAIFAAQSVHSGGGNAADGVETGKLGGFALRVAAKPTQNSKLELSHRAEAVFYSSPSQMIERQVMSGIDYATTFEDCSMVRGGYSAGPGVERRNLELKKDGFSFGVVQTIAGSARDKAIVVGYAFPLSGTNTKRPYCGSAPRPAPLFREIVDTATLRSPFLPSRLLARIASADSVLAEK